MTFPSNKGPVARCLHNALAICRAAEYLRGTGRQGHEDGIADAVPKPIIDGLEMVDIEKPQRQPVAMIGETGKLGPITAAMQRRLGSLVRSSVLER